MLDRSQFLALSSAALEHLEEALAELEHDALDVSLAGDVLTLAFEGKTPFILNAHSAALQIWLAADRSAWHFDYDDTREQWIAHKTGDELFETVARLVGERLGVDVRL